MICYNVTNKCTHFIKITKNVLIRKLLHVSALTGPSSGSAQLYKSVVHPFYHFQYVELSYVHHCMKYRDEYVHSNWSSL